MGTCLEPGKTLKDPCTLGNLELPPASESESGDMGPEKKKTFH